MKKYLNIREIVRHFEKLRKYTCYTGWYIVQTKNTTKGEDLQERRLSFSKIVYYIAVYFLQTFKNNVLRTYMYLFTLCLLRNITWLFIHINHILCILMGRFVLLRMAGSIAKCNRGNDSTSCSIIRKLEQQITN